MTFETWAAAIGLAFGLSGFVFGVRAWWTTRRELARIRAEHALDYAGQLLQLARGRLQLSAAELATLEPSARAAVLAGRALVIRGPTGEIIGIVSYKLGGDAPRRPRTNGEHSEGSTDAF